MLDKRQIIMKNISDMEIREASNVPVYGNLENVPELNYSGHVKPIQTYDHGVEVPKSARSIPAHVSKAIDLASVDDIVTQETFDEEHGLNILLVENGNHMRKLAEEGMYDFRGSGNGDVPLPGSMSRIVAMGEIGTHHRENILDVVY